MKIHQLVAIAGLLVLPSLAFSQSYLVDTTTNQWGVDRDINLTGTNSTTGLQSNGVGGTINVSKYLGGLDLTRVIIKVLQPAPSASPSITASLSSDTATAFTDNTLTNVVTERSQASANAALQIALGAYGASVGNYDVTKSSITYATSSISPGNPVDRSNNLTNGPITIFDSLSFGSLNTAALNSIFRDTGGTGEFIFNYFATSSFGWDLTTAATIIANLDGANTGQIIIEYYVPEPGTAVLVGLGGMMLLLRRRRLA